jgi:hypothetical protein
MTQEEAMAKRKNNRAQKSSSSNHKQLQALYDKYRQEFSAADLQRYTECEEGIPADKVLAELEGLYREHSRKKRA